MATTAAILAWVVSREETKAKSNQVAPEPPPPTPPANAQPPPTTQQAPARPPANAQPPPTTQVPPPVVNGSPPTPGPAPGRNFYTPLEGQPTLVWPLGCTIEVPKMMYKKNEARAFCDNTVGCKGYYHVSESGLDDNSGAYHPSSALPSDCTSLASPTSTPDSSITIFYQKEPLTAPRAAPGAAPRAAPAPKEARWQRKHASDAGHVGAWGEYQPSDAIATPNTKYTSMFRACTTQPSSDAPSCVYFASPYIAPTLCPPSTLTSDEFVPKVAPKVGAVGATATPTYGEPIPNVDGTNKPQPPACSYVGLLDETEAQERCSADSKCVGYYKNKTIPDWAKAAQRLAQNLASVYGHVPIEKEAPPDNRYRLSVAKPGECAVDWRPVENTVPVCEKLLGKRPPGQGSWMEYNGAKPGTYCLPAGSKDGFRAVNAVRAENGYKCPLGWTAREDGQCLPPCLAGQVRHNDTNGFSGHYGQWCYAEDVTSCAEGYEKYRRAGDWGAVWLIDGSEGSSTGTHKLNAWDYCVPSTTEINAIISRNRS